jgi:hypothetical protein
VLAVVELVALGNYAPRAPAGHRPGFKDGHRDAALGERHARGHSRIATPYDGYAVIHVFQAIHNFRSGVSEVRCVSTRKPSRSISSRSAR